MKAWSDHDELEFEDLRWRYQDAVCPAELLMLKAFEDLIRLKAMVERLLQERKEFLAKLSDEANPK